MYTHLGAQGQSIKSTGLHGSLKNISIWRALMLYKSLNPFFIKINNYSLLFLGLLSVKLEETQAHEGHVSVLLLYIFLPLCLVFISMF